ncbi:MAG: hypothetical protein CMF12_13655 [Idiomarina sp.]|uniref:hypothetical protein n=1 Tax=Idiomarina sp. TaxID=1874361 RepID=UPI000C6AE17F|nr:hypothetical protein [Idiomarina sp.]MBT43552.1 hypothetical protein [Idiomarina sp.]|tara:strand:+ start:854 stop:1072 length:219 start_codon:yes stop_codon:yes gene_type:complete
MTKNMRRFIDKNKNCKVISGGIITADGTAIERKKELSNSAGVEYQFEDGSRMVLRREDTQSAKHFTPKWAFC